MLIDAAAIASWQLVSEMGVMGIWTLGATIRSYLAIAFILVAIGMVMGIEKSLTIYDRLKRTEISKCHHPH